jgi:hypothetical protein
MTRLMSRSQLFAYFWSQMTRIIAKDLVKKEFIDILQKGSPLPIEALESIKGPIRFRLR